MGAATKWLAACRPLLVWVNSHIEWLAAYYQHAGVVGGEGEHHRPGFAAVWGQAGGEVQAVQAHCWECPIGSAGVETLPHPLHLSSSASTLSLWEAKSAVVPTDHSANVFFWTVRSSTDMGSNHQS